MENSAGAFAYVAVEAAAYHFDMPFCYRIPHTLLEAARPGVRVVVPFGRGNRRSRGIILSVSDRMREEDGGPGGPPKPLFAVMDEEPLLGKEMLGLAGWMSEQTFCTLYDALRLMLPAGSNLRIDRVYELSPDFPREEAVALGDRYGGPGAGGLLVQTLERAGAPVSGEKLREALRPLGPECNTRLPEILEKKGVLTGADRFEGRDNAASIRMARLCLPEPEARGALEGRELTRKQKDVVRVLLEYGSASMREIAYYTGVTAAVVTALVKKGVAEVFDKKIYRSPYAGLGAEPEPPAELSPEQQACDESLGAEYGKPGGCASLLYGVTGSGKTQVFMKLIDRVRRDGKSAIVLVPEISLTPQAVSRFISRFGRSVSVLHSGLSAGERADEWHRIREGGASIVVGTRSAVFAPAVDLGLIIIDEEQEHTYKSESSPRYHARDIARYRCAKNGAMLLLASATPSVETFHAAQTGRYHMVRLDHRYGSAQLPEVIVADLKQELRAGNDGPVSAVLLRELERNLAEGHQSILLLNRRGYNTFLSCVDCGHVLTCPNCSIALTYHSANGRVMCHYCGYSAEAPHTCPACGGGHIRYAGSGTQRAEEILSDLLPGARILRMDTDTTGVRYSHETILRAFAEEKYDILVGTQMVAKGLDFPNVTLVGVLSADQSLYMDDFRAQERTFSLLTQVVGRSGRGRFPGRAVIQTQTPENEVIALASRQDYDAFYRSEIGIRRLLLYPPFCDICIVGFTGREEPQVAGAAAAFFGKLREAAAGNPGMPLRVMGPSPAGVSRINGRYRYKILIKCRANRAFRAMVAGLLRGFGAGRESRSVAVFADINPQSIL